MCLMVGSLFLFLGLIAQLDTLIDIRMVVLYNTRYAAYELMYIYIVLEVHPRSPQGPRA